MKKEIYVATKQNYSFMVPKFGRDGKQVFKMNRVTGIESPVMESINFMPVATKSDMWNLNYLSMFEVTPDTPEHVAKRVRELAASEEVTDVITYEEHESRKNPDAARANKELRAKDEELAAVKSELEKKNTAIEEMNRRLAELGESPNEESGVDEEPKKRGRARKE